MGFEPAIPASERPQTHALDRAATVTAMEENFRTNFIEMNVKIIHLVKTAEDSFPSRSFVRTVTKN